MAFSSNDLSSFFSLVSSNKTQNQSQKALTNVYPASVAYPNVITHDISLAPSRAPHDISLAYTNSVTPTIRRIPIPSTDYMVSIAATVTCMFFSTLYPYDLVVLNDMSDGYEHKLKEVQAQLQKKENPLECFIMIDALQRLAIDYHFSEEIGSLLLRQYNLLTDDSGVIKFGGDYNLYDVSLCFRLLRQNGYHVPADVFKRFTDINGQFNPALRYDLKGMMGLFEASQLGIEGEDILDQANAFTSKHLNDSLREVASQGAARTMMYVLDNPSQKTLARFSVKHCVEITGADGILENLAQLDYNIVRSLHQSELVQFSKWWRKLGLNQQMEFARDQPVKWYMWSMAMLDDPALSKERIEVTKPISLIYILDDIFDIYGKLDQLVLLTEAINEWDLNAVEELPYCMKIFFKALDEVTNAISYKVLKEYGWDPTQSLQKAWKSLCNAFLVEAKWFASGHTPEVEDYLKNAVVSSGVHVVLIHVFFLLGHGINKDSVNLVDNIPSIISCPAAILRLWDDLGSAKDENQEGHDGSYIDCYMKEHKNSTIENARENVMHMITNEWKKLNKECLSSSLFPPSLRKASLNISRMVQMMYNYNENQQLPILEEHMRSLLYEGMPLSN